MAWLKKKQLHNVDIFEKFSEKHFSFACYSTNWKVPKENGILSQHGTVTLQALWQLVSDYKDNSLGLYALLYEKYCRHTV